MKKLFFILLASISTVFHANSQWIELPLPESEYDFSIKPTWVDLNNDGLIDLIGFDSNKATLYWYKNLNGAFSRPIIIAEKIENARTPKLIQISDLNKDGYLDAAVQIYDPHERMYTWVELINDSSQNFKYNESNFYNPKEIIAIQDLDGDGDNDLLVADDQVYENEDSEYKFITSFDLPWGTTFEAIDIEDDGIYEIVISHFDNAIGIYNLEYDFVTSKDLIGQSDWWNVPVHRCDRYGWYSDEDGYGFHTSFLKFVDVDGDQDLDILRTITLNRSHIILDVGRFDDVGVIFQFFENTGDQFVQSSFYENGITNRDDVPDSPDPPDGPDGGSGGNNDNFKCNPIYPDPWSHPHHAIGDLDGDDNIDWLIYDRSLDQYALDRNQEYRLSCRDNNLDLPEDLLQSSDVISLTPNCQGQIISYTAASKADPIKIFVNQDATRCGGCKLQSRCTLDTEGQIFFQNCNGTRYFLIRLEDGTILDPTYGPGVVFDHQDGQFVKFNYTPTDAFTDCTGIMTVEINCIVAQAKAPVAPDYQWLSALIANTDACCTTGQITSYYNDELSYVYFQPKSNCGEQLGTLYDAQGKVVCSDIDAFGCFAEKDLQEFNQEVIWQCGEEVKTLKDRTCVLDTEGTIFFQECDSIRYFLLELDDGTILDPTYGPGVEFEHKENQRVRFNYTERDLYTDCSDIQTIEINCIVDIEEVPLISNFQWIASKIDDIASCCDIGLVTAYYNENETYLYYQPSEDCDGQAGLLYDGTGKLICDDDESFECYKSMNLHEYYQETVWTCGELISNTADVQKSQISIFPNPTSDILYFENTRNASVKIYSTSGALSIRTKVEANKVNVSDLVPGIYFIRIQQTEDQVQYAKFVKI